MTAIRFNTAPHAACRSSHAPEGQEACPTNAVAAASPVEMIKRVCKFSLAIVLFMVVAGIIALKIAIWMQRFNV
jgi:hypothetical protein